VTTLDERIHAFLKENNLSVASDSPAMNRGFLGYYPRTARALITVEELAERMNVPVEDVRDHVQRAIQRAREKRAQARRPIPLTITTEVHINSIQVVVTGTMSSMELGTLIHVLTEFSTADVVSRVYRKPSGAAVASCVFALAQNTSKARAHELRDAIATRLAEALSR